MQPKLSIDLEAKIPGSKYFLWKEALWLPQMQAYAVPTDFQQDCIIAQARALDKVRDHFGYAMIIHCWLRPEKYNKLVGGASQSRHLTGKATDFHIVSVSCDEVKKVLMGNPNIYPGRGEIDTTNWVHLDLDNTGWFYGRTSTEGTTK